MKSYQGYKFCIRIIGMKTPYTCIAWLMENVKEETWSAVNGVTPLTTDYRFCNAEDALAFKLRFGGYDIR